MNSERKPYIKPSMEEVDCEPLNTALLAASGEDGHGHAGEHGHACEHGHHWFCDDDD